MANRSDRADSPLMTVPEAVRFSGLSKQTICRMCDAGEVPAAKIHNRWLINREAFQALFKEALEPAPV